MNGIRITVSGAERRTQFYSPVVPPTGSEIYIKGYYYTVVRIEYHINDTDQDECRLEAEINVVKLREA